MATGYSIPPHRSRAPALGGACVRRMLPLAVIAVLLLAAPVADAVPVKLKLPEVDHIELVETGPGTHHYELTREGGHVERLSPQQFAERVYREHSQQPWLYSLLNISSAAGIAWVAFGLLAQVMFMGRMVVQWLHSERARRSVVPPVFWWMSLLGATMLLIYFVWRRDIVGVLGQSAGWLIYVRNLWLIYRSGSSSGSPPS
jgi:lipid-A-disaccharide synthase-like uncharacterized protein